MVFLRDGAMLENEIYIFKDPSKNTTVPKQNPKARGTVPRAAPSAAAPSLGKTLRPVGQAVGLHVLAKHKTSAKP